MSWLIEDGPNPSCGSIRRVSPDLTPCSRGSKTAQAAQLFKANLLTILFSTFWSSFSKSSQLVTLCFHQTLCLLILAAEHSIFVDLHKAKLEGDGYILNLSGPPSFRIQHAQASVMDYIAMNLPKAGTPTHVWPLGSEIFRDTSRPFAKTDVYPVAKWFPFVPI